MCIKRLDMTIESSQLHHGVDSVIRMVRPLWDYSKVEFKVFTDGISNQLMGCFPNNGEAVLLVRVYGLGTELFVDRKAEQETMIKLSEAGLGPKLVATFNNGLVYNYIPGTVLNVDTVSLPHIWPLVARRLGRMHQLPVNEDKAQLWIKLETFLNLLPEDLLDQQAFKKVAEKLTSKQKLISEVAWLKSKLHSTTNKTVFCHNDLLLANVIITENGNDVTFIDYEYSGLNYQAYDIANHFNEFAGVDDVDYSRLPSQEFKKKWIREYLIEYEMSNDISSEQVDQLYNHVEQFLCPNHLVWALWSLVQALHSKLDFSFADYAISRLNEYWKTKSNLKL